MPPRYLTKSRFKLGRECPTKLFYTGEGKKNIYPDRKMDDSFLQALANGGYQVGELAKQYYPGGKEVSTLDSEAALKKTNNLLEKENVIIYEAAIRYENLFIRADVLIKKGNFIRIVEVKAKSCEGKSAQQFLGKKGYVLSEWMPYLEDIAFQKYVTKKAFPDHTVTSSLMLADKTFTSPTTGLNQKFKVSKDENRRKGVQVSSELNEDDLSQPLLSEIAVDSLVQMIFEGEAINKKTEQSFEEYIKFLAESYNQDSKVKPVLSAVCNKCEFTCTPEEERQGKKSGFKECWSMITGLPDQELNAHLVTELWYGGYYKLAEKGIYRIKDIHEGEFEEKDNTSGPGLNRSQRQWLQINKIKNNDDSIYFDEEGLLSEIESWVYPLHFIDFETSAVAIPFYSGKRPYEQIAFQFSHHIMYENGKVEHTGQFLNTTPGEFPNYSFVRELKRQLESDHGTIFRFHNHENTILCSMLEQLKTDSNPPEDSEELCEFILNVTHSPRESVVRWKGDRNMVDLQQMVVRYYYDPDTKGSNSIKNILPSVLNRSSYLQDKYSKPVYKTGEVTSLNFPLDHIWLDNDHGVINDPYKSLPPVFDNIEQKQLDLISDDHELRDGGAALTAYGVLQFTEMTSLEREKMNAALLRYCELDTLAMVMIFEAWREWI